MFRIDKYQFVVLLLLLVFTNAESQQQELPEPLKQAADSAILLNDVTVVAYRVRGRLHTIPGNLSVLPGEIIRLTGGTSFATAINTVPGVTMQTGTFLTNRIVIRGMGSRTPYNTNRIRAYLNEIPLTTSDGVSTPEEIDLQNLGKIEVIKGPSSALYGSGLGGSINLYTPEKNKNEGIFNTHLESFSTFRNHLSGTLITGKASLWGSINQLSSRGYRENNDYNRISILTTTGWKQPKWSVNTTLLLSNIKGGIPSSVGRTLFETNPEAAAPNWKEIGGYKKYFKGVAAVTLTNIFSESVTNDFSVFGKWNDNYEKRPFNNLDDQSLSGGLRNKLTYRSGKFDLVAGAELITEQYKWSIDIDEVVLNRNLEKRLHFNLFTIGYYRPVPEVNISLAGALNNISYRLKDLFDANGDQSGIRTFPLIFSPRIGINYAPGNTLAFYASAGHGFSLPSPEETLLPAGDVNAGIKPEQGFQYETGIRLNIPFINTELDGTVYLIDLNDLLLTKRVTEDIFTGINAGKTRHQGVELLLKNRWFESDDFPGKLSSIISYSRSLNRFIEFIDDDISYNGNNLPGIPDQSLQFQLKWDPMKILEFITNMRYTGDQYLNDLNSMKYKGYFLMDLKAVFHFKTGNTGPHNFYAGINNLTGTHYASMLIVNAIGFGNNEPRYYYPGLPRHIYAGLSLEF